MPTVNRTESPWGLNRISQKDKLEVQDTLSKTFIYRYLDPDTQTGPVNIYVIGMGFVDSGPVHSMTAPNTDSGVRITHDDFEGRASWGYVNPDTPVLHKRDI